MRKSILYFLPVFLTISISHANTSNNTSTKQLPAVRVQEKIVIDGRLTEDIWKRPGFTGLVQQEPSQGSPPSQKSEVWFAYDDEAFYFAAKYYDNNPDSIVARLVRRDFIWGDPSDGCVLYLDSYRDKRNGYFFYVSAAGTLADGLIENDAKQPNDLSWDAVWEGVPYIDKDGYSVEMKIPYSQLRFKEGDNQQWGINVERYISRRNETDMIAYTPRNENGFASRFPDLVGIEGITPSARFETLPYITGKAEYIGNNPNDPFNPGQKYLPGFGLDIRAGLGSSLTLNGTINPDFGQVELDPAIVNLSDVEFSFQEKRPFFTEGVNIYRFGNGGTNNNVSFNWPGVNIFYSRRIGRAPQGSLPNFDFADIPSGTHILGAAKVSGRILGEWKIGTIHALTRREYADIDYQGIRSSVEIEPLTYYGVLRTQRDFNDGEQGIGILSTFTNRFFKDNNLMYNVNKDAFVTGVDGWTFLDRDRTYVLTSWIGLSRVSGDKDRMISLQRSSGHYFQRPDVDYLGVDTNATSMTGYAGRFMLNKNRGQFSFNASVGFLSPKFEVNDLGFGSYSDLINGHFFMTYRWTEPTSVYQWAGINAATYVNYDFGGNKTTHGYFIGSYITLRDIYYGGNINMTYNPYTFNSRRTRGGPLTLNPISRTFNLNLFTDNREWWVLNVGGSLRNSDEVNSKYLYTYLEFKVSSTLTVSVGPELYKDNYKAQWVTSFADETADDTYGRRYVFANMDQTTFAAEIRADWILSPKLSFQVYLQPLIASGNYYDFKTLRKPKTFDFVKFGEDGSSIEEVITESGNKLYTLDADSDGPSIPYTIGNPDFNYISLRGSAVLRWEYLPGSALYLVWTQSRQDVDPSGQFQFGNSMNRLFEVKPDNIFMLKLTYWFGM